MSAPNYVPGVGKVVFPDDVVEAVAAPGQKDTLIADTLADPRVRAVLDRISRAWLVDSLLGIWSLSALEAVTISQLEARFLWVVCCNLREEREEREEEAKRAELASLKAIADAEAARECPGTRRVRAVIVVTFEADSFEREENVLKILDKTTEHITTELGDFGVKPSVWLEDVYGGHTSRGMFPS